MITKDELKAKVQEYIDTEEPPVREVQEINKVLNTITYGTFEPYLKEDGEMDYEFVPYSTTYWDEVAYLFNSFGCYVSNNVDYWTGEVSYTIGFPANEAEYQENLKIFNETW